jgi:hypothetical protein
VARNLKFWNAWEIVLESRQFQVLAGASIMTLLGFVASSEVANSQSAIIDLDFNNGSYSPNSNCQAVPDYNMLYSPIPLSSCESYFELFRERKIGFEALVEIYDEPPYAPSDKTLARFAFRNLKGLGIADLGGHSDTYLYEINEGEALKLSVARWEGWSSSFVRMFPRYAFPLITRLDFGFLFGPGSGDDFLEQVLVEAFADETFLGQGTLSVNSDETTASWEFVCDSGIQNNCNIDGAEVINDPDVASIIPNGGFGPGRYNVRYPFGKRSVNSFNETITHLIIKPQDSAEGTVHDFGLVGVTVNANDVPEPSSFLALISVGAIAGGIKLKKKAD